MGGAALSAALVLAGLYAYYAAFSSFAYYDDEGFLEISLHHFIQGRPIYDQVFTQYGAFYYLFHGAIFQLAGVPVDNDSMRLVVIGIWLGCAALGALFTLRLSGSVPLAVAVLALTAAHLRALASEPGHPQGLSMLLVMSLPAAAAFCSERRRTLICSVLGALVGCLVMTKLNVGVFALLAVALALSAAIPGRLAALAQVAASLAMLALPAILMRSHLASSAYDYAWCATLLMLPIVLLLWTNRPIPLLRTGDGVIAAIACAGAVLVSCAAIAIHGTSLRQLVNQPLEQAMKFPTLHPGIALVDRTAVYLCAAAVILCLGVAFARRRWPTRILVALALSAINLSYGMYVFYQVYASKVGVIQPSGIYASDAYVLLVTALPFVWLPMIPRSRTTPQPVDRFARALLCTLAAIVSLQVYPMVGSQLTFATVLVILAAALCLHDGLATVLELLPSARPGYWVRSTAAGLAIAALLMAQWGMVRTMRQSFHSLVPLDLPGATRLRMPEQSVALYRWLTFNLRAYADTFIGMPAVNSLYFWTEQEPPTDLNPNSWMLLLDDNQQRSVVQSLSEHPNACAVVIPGLIEFWMRGRPMPPQPLATYIDSEFETVGRFRGYQFRVRKDRNPPELIYSARRLEPPAAGQPGRWQAELSLPAMQGRAVHRMRIATANGRRTLADTQAVPGGSVLQVMGESADGEARVFFTAGGIDLAQPRRLLLRIESPSAALQKDGLIVRLFDEHDRVFASVPVVS